MTIDLSRICVELEEHERWRRTLSFEVTADVLRAEREKTSAQLARRLKLPGFRKGKAPASAIERQYGQTIERETLERVVGELYQGALEERGLHPITEGEIEDVEYEPGGALKFKASFEIRPLIQPSRLGGFRVTRPAARVDPAEVEDVLQRLLQENAIWRPPDDDGKARNGDLVTVLIVPLGESAAPGRGVGLPWAQRLRLRSNTKHRGRYQFVLGEGDAVPDLEQAVLGLAPGETGEFTVRDDGAPSAPLELRITLEDRRMQELPVLDDAFARSLGEFAGLAALRRKISSDLEAEASDHADAVLRDRLLDQVLSANPFDAPVSLIEQQRISMSDNVLRTNSVDIGTGPGEPASAEAPGLQEAAEAAVKRALLIDCIVEMKGLGATREETEQRISEVASRGGVSPDLVRQRLVQSNRLDALERDITERKVFEFLIGQSEVVNEG